MARPGLQQLLTDIVADKVDVIVVYKVDRLTRSLADFARIVDTLDKAGASFVSVTQAFNTTSSMGRLTLNVLLSFAQFEREVTSERIRDKVAASKRKGMWMGGPIPIGYRLGDRKLVIDDAETATVRIIFERYVALRSIAALADELAVCGVRTKVRTYSNGKTVGGIAFMRGTLATLLKNPVYIGKVAQGGLLRAGQHDGIIEEALWKRVQDIMSSNGRERRTGSSTRYPSLLTGVLTDPDGRPMSPTFASKGSRRHLYYVTRLNPGEDRSLIWRVPAGEVDRAVLVNVRRWLREHSDGLRGDEDADTIMREASINDVLAEMLGEMSIPEQRAILLDNRDCAARSRSLADQLRRRNRRYSITIAGSPRSSGP